MSSVLNIERALDYMRQYDLDVLIATSAYNVRYFSGYSCWLDSSFKKHMIQPGDSDHLLCPSYAFLLVNGQRALVVAASNAVNAVHLRDIEIHCYGNPGLDYSLLSDSPSEIDQGFIELFHSCRASSTSLQGLVSALIKHGLRDASIGIELVGISKEATTELSQSLPKARWRDCSNLIRLIRAVKTSEEVRLLASAAEIAETAAMSSLELAHIGESTGTIVQHFMAHIAQLGASFDHFSFSLDGLGICADLPWPFQREDVLFIDFGCVYSSYFSDSGTTLVFADLRPDIMNKYRALQASFAAGVQAMRPGVKSSSIQKAMWDTLAEHGISNCFPHGHGMGIELRDYPILVPSTGLPIRDDCVDVDSDLALEPGMVLNLETPLFLATIGALQIEKTYVITEDGCRGLLTQNRTSPYVAVGGQGRQK